ncbi:hypothetical protein WJX73_001304 [Symbiochloris irregularis]|uniref:Uncharacterized protein n=1 Tax=Symbiochloris irregularis TaxID=706552 RepID=A0AAW1NND7_9CHLO
MGSSDDTCTSPSLGVWLKPAKAAPSSATIHYCHTLITSQQATVSAPLRPGVPRPLRLCPQYSQYSQRQGRGRWL